MGKTGAPLLYPEIEPARTGMMPVGDGHEVAWEESGNLEGKPVVFLHGGPGSGCTPHHRRLFDPQRYRIVLFDQRGAGRSTPNAGEPDADMAANTTWHLVSDIERLRAHLGIRRWQVFGGSWGSLLALAYAEQHPDRVTELIIRGVFTSRRKELDWSFGGGAGFLHPEQWEKLLAPIPASERDDVLAAYDRLLSHQDPSVRHAAAEAWSRFEGELVSLHPNPEFVAEFTAPEKAAALARIEVHFFRNGCFLEEGQLIRDAPRLGNMPGVIVQGRYDVVTPPVTAWELHQQWPGSALHMIPDAGHAFDEPGIARALVAATDRFA